MSEQPPKSVPARPRQVILDVLERYCHAEAVTDEEIADHLLNGFEEADIDLAWWPTDGDVASG